MTQRKDQRDRTSIMTRRMMILGGIQAAMGAILIGRLYQLQINQSENYRQLSDNNQFDKRLVQASRGRILDSKGRLLAGNSEVFELKLLPSRVENHADWLAKVGRIITLKPDEIEAVLQKINDQPNFLEVTVKSDLSQRELSRLAVLSPILEGASFQKSFKRIYPQGWMTAHITGYVSPANQQDIEDNPELRFLPDSRIGRSGIEKTLEKPLRGFSGRERVEMNARGKPVRVLRDKSAQPGRDITLTIDVGAQSFATDRLRQGKSEIVPVEATEVQHALLQNDELRAHITLGDNMVLKDSKGRLVPPESGSIIAIDIHNGDIKLMVSAPGFDPNLFSNRLSIRDWQRLNAHPRTPLLNRITSGLYPPGSTFKMVVLAAALEAGVITSKTRFNCTGKFEFGNRIFHCWNQNGHGAVDAIRSLERSCDIYYYQIALKTGINRIYNMAHRLGLGTPTDLGLSDEKSGIIPNRDWKLKSRGVAWTPGETVVAGIGQGFVLTTPIQLAVMTARIANGRYAVTPRLFRPYEDGQSSLPQFKPLDIAPEIIQFLRQGMRAVMVGGQGTARQHDLPFGIAGKTGTVQVKRITKKQREEGITDNIDRPWRERDHALFVAYAPTKQPRYALSVIVEHGGSGSSMAAPIAKDVFQYLVTQEGGIS